MSISGVMTSAVSALNANIGRVSATADNISNVNTAGYKAKQVGTISLVTKQTVGTGYASGGVKIFVQEEGRVDLSREYSNLMRARASYSFNVKSLKTGEEMVQALLDVMA